MKRITITALVFILLGLMFLVLGSVSTISQLKKMNDRIYATATIVEIEHDSKYNPNTHKTVKTSKTYVAFDMDGVRTERRLNVYHSSFEVGKEVDICYFADDSGMVYQKGSLVTLFVFPIVGAMITAFGAALAFHKRFRAKIMKFTTSRFQDGADA